MIWEHLATQNADCWRYLFCKANATQIAFGDGFNKTHKNGDGLGMVHGWVLSHYPF